MRFDVHIRGAPDVPCSNARNAIGTRPRASHDLIDAETYLSIHVRIELAASLRRIRSAIDILAAELPEEDDEDRRLRGRDANIG